MKNRLLIIGCCDAKNRGGVKQIASTNFISNDFLRMRAIRFNYYLNLFTQDSDYFINKTNGHNYLFDCKVAVENNLKLPAYERYRGRFYDKELKKLYSDYSLKFGLHILIISGLYGVIKFNEPIIYYHLEIKKGGNWYSNIIHNEILEYITNNNIQDEDVYYSLSDSYLNALKPKKIWNNLWINASDSSSLLKSRNSLKDKFSSLFF